jgi:apolipoprotein D and lipocalin family protein
MNKRISLFLTLLVYFFGCSSVQALEDSNEGSMPVVDYVDLERFMGDWYVIATIPTFLEKDAYNPVETYKRDDDGTIATTFTFNKGSLDGPSKVFRPRGFVMDKTTNAIWGMQFVWPIKADYRIVYLDGNYQQTIIGRNSRDYVWIMARTPSISEQDYTKLVGVVKSLGYELDALQKAIHAK